MSLSVEIIKKRKNTTAPWEVRAIQSVIKQNFWDSPEVIPSISIRIRGVPIRGKRMWRLSVKPVRYFLFPFRLKYRVREKELTFGYFLVKI